MTDWQLAGLLWLALSFVLAPIVAQMIHNRDDCPECRANRGDHGGR